MRRDRGFSLLELVAVLAIFAMVALIGVQTIQASVQSSERLTKISDQSAELALAMALLRQDLEAAYPAEFAPPRGGSDPALVVADAGFALSVGGQTALSGQQSSGLGRVVWRFDRATGQIQRQVWTSLTPGDRQAIGAATVVLQDVETFELDSFNAQGGWRRGFDADPRERAGLPLGLRARLVHARFGALEIVVNLR